MPARQILKQVGSRFRRQRVAAHLGAEMLQPQRQPGALEAGMAGHQHAPVAPEIVVRGRHRGASKTLSGRAERVVRDAGTPSA